MPALEFSSLELREDFCYTEVFMADKEKLAKERMEEYTQLREKLTAEGYTEHKAVISILKANVVGCAIALPLIILFSLLFVILALEKDTTIFDSIVRNEMFLFLTIIVSIPIHELLHGAGWILFCKDGRKSINFGFMWKSLTPYCHCSEALRLAHYYIGLIAPFFFLGIIPCVVSLFNGSVFLLLFGFFGIIGAGGDLAIGCTIFKYIGKNALLLDHPSECGCAVFTKD